jgi:uncharacterized protein (TIGR02285 family)
MPRPLAALLLALLMGLWLTLPARAQPTLTWALVDGPPAHEHLGARSIAELGGGLQDQRLRLLSAALPQFRHKVQLMSLSQLWRDMRAGRPVCYADAFKTAERLAWAHFVELAPSPRLVLAARPGRLPPGAELSLRELLARKDLRGAFEMERSYGELIDRLLAEHGQTRLPLPSDPRLLRMLEQGRMDYVLEYPSALGSDKALQSVDLRLVLEDRNPAPTQLACTRALGLELMRSLDAAARRLAQQEAWAQLHLQVYPAGAREALRPQLEQYFRERAQQGERIH